MGNVIKGNKSKGNFLPERSDKDQSMLSAAGNGKFFHGNWLTTEFITWHQKREKLNWSRNTQRNRIIQRLVFQKFNAGYFADFIIGSTALSAWSNDDKPTIWWKGNLMVSLLFFCLNYCVLIKKTLPQAKRRKLSLLRLF